MREFFRSSWRQMPNTWICAIAGGIIGLLVLSDLIWFAIALCIFVGIGVVIGMQLDGKLDLYALFERIRTPRGGRG